MTRRSDTAINRRMNWASPIVAALLVAAVSGCGPASESARNRTVEATTGSGSGTGTGGAGTTTTTDGGSSAGTTTTTGGIAPDDPGVPELPSNCEASMPGDRLLRRLTQQELDTTHDSVFPSAAAASTVALPGDLQGSVRLTNDASTLMMGSQMAEAILARGEQIADAVTAEPALSNAFPCAANADSACATEFIDSYAASLFRRPIADTERTRYLALYDSVSSRSDFATGLKWALVAMIQSPYSVYRSELGDGSGQLTPYEIASELSYDYSGAPPSGELIALAESGGLADPDARVAQAKSLLMGPGGQRVMQQFFGEWLTYEAAANVNRANVPDNFEATIRPKMVLETQAFIDDLLFTRGGTVGDLLTANYTVADSDLSAFYGFSGGSGDLFNGGGVEVTRSHGVGIFAQGSVLTTMASITITSPTRRGLLLLKRLFCEVPGAPQAASFDLTRSDVTGNTTRERLENSHLQEACKSCHSLFDPLGFAFENFDNIGRYRTQEVNDAGSFDIDATTELARLGGQVVTGQEELMATLATAPEVLSCVSGTFTRFVYGSSGSCRDKDARAQVLDGQISIVDYLAELAREPHFVSRQ